MLAKRIIPCLDVKDGRVVKGTQFLNLTGYILLVFSGRHFEIFNTNFLNVF
jgi:imidazole glycerol phosphate synthase subunit HisF